MTPDYISTFDAAQLSGWSRSTILKLIYEERIRHTRLEGGKRPTFKIHRADFVKFLESIEVKPK